MSPGIYCLTARILDPSSASSTQSSSSGTPYPIVNYVTCDKFSATHIRFLAAVTTGHQPTHFSEAARDPFWREAMKAEIEALELNGTWTVEDLQPEEKVIGCKWVYKIKTTLIVLSSVSKLDLSFLITNR